MSKENIFRMVELARENADKGANVAAEVYYRMILLDTTPPEDMWQRMANAEGCVFYARKALLHGRHGDAADWYQRAVFADPLAVDTRVEYIQRALMPMNMLKNARIEAERATKIEPDNAKAWRWLGLAEHALGNSEAAIVAHDRQLELDPDNPLARIDRAGIAIDIADYQTARDMARPVFDTEHKGEALHVFGMCAYREASHEAAIAYYQEALEVGMHDLSQLRWNMSLAMHAIGDYEHGWPESEYRGKQKADGSMRLIMNRFSRPTLQRYDAPCRVHVHQEMGHGDTIAMARYLDTLVELGHTVSFECNETIVALMARSFPRVNVMPKAVDYPSAMGVPAFDKHIAALSLPALFGTTVYTVPWRGAYIKPDPELVRQYADKLPKLDTRKVGLCWSSGLRLDGLWLAEYGRRKSMHFNDLRPILQAGEWTHDFISLQVGPERSQHGFALIDILPAQPTWDDTAAVIANLDLVITVDTSVAHLAGAMGKPVWIMAQRDCQSWHFMCYRDGAFWNTRSPWYPSARIFRQHEFNRPHFWDEVVLNVAEDLRQLKALAA